MKEVIIFGSGISGLVAAINLAQSGFEVEVHEKRSQVGGAPEDDSGIGLLKATVIIIAGIGQEN